MFTLFNVEVFSNDVQLFQHRMKWSISLWIYYLLLSFYVFPSRNFLSFVNTYLQQNAYRHLKRYTSVCPRSDKMPLFVTTPNFFLHSHAYTKQLHKHCSATASSFRKNAISDLLKKVSKRSFFPAKRCRQHPELIQGMQYRQLGETELIVSEIGLGTEHMGAKSLIDDDSAIAQLEIATKEYGINLLDIAEYDPVPSDVFTWGRGHTEILRKFLKTIPRESIILSIRLCSGNLGKEDANQWLFKWIRKEKRSPRFTRKDLEEAIDGLLHRLDISYIDILQLDRPTRYIPRSELGEDTYCWGFEKADIPCIEEQIALVNAFITAGKVRYIGLCNETPWGAFQWIHTSKKMGYPPVASIQAVYNILHRNEFESSGFPEMLHPQNLNLPLLAYGSLAGGILTGKYLDPERFNVRGPDQRLGQDEWDNYVSTYRGKIPEDWGYLSYGPRTGKCNKYPEFYHTHRSVWSQWKLGELIKIGRTHGLSMAQLALGWVYSRAFVGSTLIGPRTIGQLRESVRTLNYPILPSLETSVHEIFLRYRAPTMGGPQILSSLEDSPKPQHDYIKYARGPIWSGGMYWPNFPQPILPKKVEFQERYVNLLQLMAMGGVFDDPSDANWKNFRLWKERLEENKLGEYFAVKEAKLFGWTEKKFSNWNWHNLTLAEKHAVDTDDFHFVWKNGKVTREKSSQAMLDFYKNEALVLELLQMKIASHQDELKYEKQIGKVKDVFNALDFDLIDKRLRKEHNVDILNKETLRQLYSAGQNLTEDEIKTIPYWYIEIDHPDSVIPQKPPGSFY